MKKEHALKMIEKGFQDAVKRGEVADMTYYNRIKTFVNQEIAKKVDETKNKKLWNPKFWKGSFAQEYIDNCIDRYQNDDLSATYIENTVHAFHKFGQLVKEHQILGKKVDKVRMGFKGSVKNGNGYLGQLHNEGVVDNKDHVTSMKPTGDELQKVINAIPDTNRNKETIVNLLQAQQTTGGRIKAELKLKKSDIDFKNGLKTYHKDKNKFTRRTEIDKEYMDFYKDITDKKFDGSPLFALKRKDGSDMSADEGSRYVSEVLKRAAEKAGVNYITTITKKDKEGNEREVEVEMRFTTHSIRRKYGQKEYDKTRFWNKEKIKKAIGDYLKQQGSNKERIQERINNERERINYFNIKNGKEPKDFSWEQYRRLYTSLKLGHSRLSVVSRYVEFDEPISKRKK